MTAPDETSRKEAAAHEDGAREDPKPDETLGRLEASLAELEALVEKLEGGDLPLEQALEEFERGIKLTRECQSALREAEQKVEILLKDDGEPVPFETRPEQED